MELSWAPKIWDSSIFYCIASSLWSSTKYIFRGSNGWECVVDQLRNFTASYIFHCFYLYSGNLFKGSLGSPRRQKSEKVPRHRNRKTFLSHPVKKHRVKLPNSAFSGEIKLWGWIINVSSWNCTLCLYLQQLLGEKGTMINGSRNFDENIYNFQST